MARAWTWPFSSAASVSLTSRWRSTRDLPANSGDITSTRKWLSPVPGELWWPACTCDSLITSSRVGRSAIISFSRMVAAIDIQEALRSTLSRSRRDGHDIDGFVAHRATFHYEDVRLSTTRKNISHFG